MPTPDGHDATLDVEPVIVQRVQPYQARKTYLCPGCHQNIPPRLGHLVVVPETNPDDRTHWHHACWPMRYRRRPGRP
jgi:hypothetical protein